MTSTDLPATMRAGVLTDVGMLDVQIRKTPSPGPGDVVVRIASVGVCGSDVHYYREGRIGPARLAGPLVLGHEASGTIVDVGADVSRSRIGERVSLEPGVPHGLSPATLSGHYNLDPGVRFLGTPPVFDVPAVDGAFVEFLAHPAAFAHAVPDSVSEDAAALLEPLSVAISATDAAAVTLGSRVLVSGSGPIGLLVAAVARHRGAAEVVVTDVRAERLPPALAHGATRAVLAGGLADSEVFDAFIDASGAERAVISGIEHLAPRGRAVLVGMGAETVAIPVAVLQSREIIVTGTFRYANTWRTAVALAASGAIDLDLLVTSHHDLTDVRGALEAGATPGALKAVVHPTR